MSVASRPTHSGASCPRPPCLAIAPKQDTAVTPESVYQSANSRIQRVVDDILDRTLPLNPGVHVVEGVGNTVILTVVGRDGKRRGEMRVARDAIDADLTGFLEAWSMRTAASPLQLVSET